GARGRLKADGLGITPPTKPRLTTSSAAAATEAFNPGSEGRGRGPLQRRVKRSTPLTAPTGTAGPSGSTRGMPPGRPPSGQVSAVEPGVVGRLQPEVHAPSASSLTVTRYARSMASGVRWTKLRG